MVKITVGIEGMACGMCEAHINEAVRNAFQVKKVTSSHTKKQTVIIAGLPEFEKEDRFKMNIVNCALLAAFVLNMPERPDVKRLTAYYAGSMLIPSM